MLGVIVVQFDNGTLTQRSPSDEADSWEYQTISVNLAVHNQFPVMGYIHDHEEYKLSKFEIESNAAFLKCRFESIEPIYNLSKPPAYAFILGMLYRWFGIDLSVPYYLNLFFLLCTFLLITRLGNSLWGPIGASLGILSFSIFLMVGNFGIADVLPELMTTTLATALVYLSVELRKGQSFIKVLLLGTLAGCTMLTKGVVVFFILSIPIVLWIYRSSYSSFIKSKLVLAICICFTILPWTISANRILSDSEKRFDQWSSNLETYFSNCERNNFPDNLKNFDVNQIIIDHYARYANTDKPVIVSNQFSFDELPAVHNELCIDGKWHVEWRYVEDLSYNTIYKDLEGLTSIFRFYSDNPDLIFTIACAKINLATRASHFPILLATALMSLMILARRFGNFHWKAKILGLTILSIAVAASIKHLPICMIFSSAFFCSIPLWKKTDSRIVPLPFILLLLNCLLITIVFYGSPRFISFGEPVFIFFSSSILFKFLKSDRLSINQAIT